MQPLGKKIEIHYDQVTGIDGPSPIKKTAHLPMLQGREPQEAVSGGV
jgi:hypothetical protein